MKLCFTFLRFCLSMLLMRKEYEFFFVYSAFFVRLMFKKVERKRHIGNDIVVLIFKDGTSQINPVNFRSHFNRISPSPSSLLCVLFCWRITTLDVLRCFHDRAKRSRQKRNDHTLQVRQLLGSVCSKYSIIE